MIKKFSFWYTGAVLAFSVYFGIRWWIGFLKAGSFSMAETEREFNVLVTMAILSVVPYFLLVPLFQKVLKSNSRFFVLTVGFLATLYLIANMLYQITGVLGFPVAFLVVLASFFTFIFDWMKKRKIRESP